MTTLEQLAAWMATRENEHLEFKEAKNQFDLRMLVRGRPQALQFADRRRRPLPALFQVGHFAHRHSCIAYLPPAVVHKGCAACQRTQDAAHYVHPERFINGPPKAAKAAINPTNPEQVTEITN